MQNDRWIDPFPTIPKFQPRPTFKKLRFNVVANNLCTPSILGERIIVL